MMDAGLPTASAAEYPKMRSAALFQVVIRPSRPWLKMASSEYSTMAERYEAAPMAWLARTDRPLRSSELEGSLCRIRLCIRDVFIGPHSGLDTKGDSAPISLTMYARAVRLQPKDSSQAPPLSRRAVPLSNERWVGLEG